MSEPLHSKPPYQVGKPINITIGMHSHACWPITAPLAGDPEFDRIGIAIVVMPKEDDTPAQRKERKATADFIAEACNSFAILRTELENIANAKLSNFESAEDFQGWARSRAAWALEQAKEMK